MFLFAEEFKDAYPELSQLLAHRFPVFIIDEAQDCSEPQCSILSKLLPKQEDLLIYQRFGDGNQAIFNSANDTTPVTTDPFPCSSHTRTISKSHRLHASIAALADPLGLQPYNMEGNGGIKEAPSKHSIFLFDDNCIDKVLPGFSALVLNQFSEHQLNGSDCFAVGQVHNTANDNPVGAHVQHYWPAYCPAINKVEPSAEYLVDFFRSAIDQVEVSKALNKGLDQVSKGLMDLLRQGGFKELSLTRRPYRYLRDLSIEHMDTFTPMFANIQSALISPLTKSKWETDLLDSIRAWCYSCFEIAIDANHSFLQWGTTTAKQDKEEDHKNHNANIFNYSSSGREVNIQLGSIHSVKGQTHRATLVLDTFWHNSNLTSISDWLCNKKQGSSGTGVRNLNRLKCHYVAMTRPTDLLCLAINKSKTDSAMRDALIKSGWNLVEL
jgi:hypothetical protein